MSFPGTYNINYYKGDTFEFRVYPKDSSGAPFDLTGYQSSDVKFSIAAARGADEEDIIEGYTEISEDLTSILCVITPTNSSSMDASQYVYDVEIGKHGANYDLIYTLLTGVITVTDEVTPLRDILPPPEPEEPGTVTILGTVETSSTIDVAWSAPTTGDTPITYKLYLIPYSPAFEGNLTALLSGLSLLTPFETENTLFSFTTSTAVPAFAIPAGPVQPETAYVYAIVATNEVGDGLPAGSFDTGTGSITPVTTLAEES